MSVGGLVSLDGVGSYRAELEVALASDHSPTTADLGVSTTGPEAADPDRDEFVVAPTVYTSPPVATATGTVGSDDEGDEDGGEPAAAASGGDDSEQRSALTHDWVIRTAGRDQMRVGARFSTSWPLLRMYAVRQVQLRYRQSALGLSWTLVQPIFVMAIYGFVFTRFFMVTGGDFPYLSMAWTGLTIWGFVQVSIQMGGLALLNDAYMLSRVWFPREIIPLAPVVAGLVDLGAGVVILIPLVMLQGVGFSIQAIAMPIILFVLIVWVAAISVITATITIFFRDMATIVGLGLRLLFIGTPVMYAASAVPPQFGWVLAGNPFAVVINNTRNVLLAHVWPNWQLLAFHGTIGLVLLVGGLKYLRSVERRMVDIV